MRITHLCMAMSLLSLLCACAVTAHRGFYEGMGAPAWSHSVEVASGGTNVYVPSIKPLFPFAVVFSTPERGRIAMVINFPQERPAFRSKEVVVAFESGKRQAFEAQQSMVFDVTPSDAFTITVPPFRLNGVEFPELVAAFKWNESTKYYIRGIQ